MTDLAIALLLICPLVTALLCFEARRIRLVETINATGASLTLLLAIVTVVKIAQDGPIQTLRGWIYLDALSGLMIIAIAGLCFAASLVSIGYLRQDPGSGEIRQGRSGVRWYFSGFHAFVFTMLATVSADNLGLLWVGIEATTIASALLVGFYRTRAAIEAAWKYLILCTAGITCALFGVVFTYYAARQGGAPESLDWSTLAQHSGELDPSLMRLAFVFILVGFGTKAGFAPLHTWLADAHSAAPSPISGVLSGVLLGCALYGILRFHVLTTGATASDFSANLLLAFGLLSVAVAAPFIVAQRHLKRLLAYSSVEHIGLMAVAFGIGGPLGVTAGLLHFINHAATKSLLFFLSGDIIHRYGNHRISAIRGALRLAPVTGTAFLLGIFAITGAPGSGIFVSEIALLGAGFQGDWQHVATVTAVALLLAVIFASLVMHAVRIAYDHPPHRPEESHGPAMPAWLSLVALMPLVLIVVVFGIHLPAGVDRFIDDAAATLGPVAQ
jgi:hydrogenase-4 component F